MTESTLRHPGTRMIVEIRSAGGSLTEAFDAIYEVTDRIEDSDADIVAIAFSGPRDRSDVGRFFVRALALQAELRGKRVLFLN